MSYRKPNHAQAARQAAEQAAAEWRAHVEDHPGHVSYHVAIPIGWLCCGGMDGARCGARSTSVQGLTQMMGDHGLIYTEGTP